ncbi:MAG TPA: HAMP domain-containing sensor histidine kinase [Puia sp.]|nr:HAMP domain-containing sensor histidine kinase [Puia sp.]
MSVRFRITFLFAAIVLVILMLVCGSVYYFSFKNRENYMKTKLTNWAITTGSLLSQSSVFGQQLILKIDASTTLAMKDKTVQAYDDSGKRKFIYSDYTPDTVRVDKKIIDKAQQGTDLYFTSGNREAIAHYYRDANFRAVMITAAFDEEGKKKLQQLKFILWLSFAGGILIAIIAGYFFSKQLLIPLRKISDEVNDISAQSISRRIKAGRSKDEWNYLSSTLNGLLNRLQESFDTHRRFISNASHELITPLTSISSQLEISLNKDRDAAAYRAVMESIYQDVRRLGRLTQTLLEFARASGDPSGLEIDLVRIDEVLLALPGEISKLNKYFTVVLKFEDLPDEDEKLLVFGNEELLFTAIKNIVINACKYSDDHVAKVNLSFERNVINILIEDRGRGIPEQEIEKIFQPFYRVEDNNPGQGFGLGLALAQQIIKLHKGQVSLKSEIGEGTSFTIVLPMAGGFLK